MTRGRGIKLGNDYVTVLGDLYDEMPKAVFAAIAVSLATQGGDELDHAKARLVEEWKTLHANGIVPQKPREGSGAMRDAR